MFDFKQLKHTLQPVVDYLDHQMINDLQPFTEINPSAENLAHYFFEKTCGRVADATDDRMKVKQCVLYETCQSSATYCA